MTDEAVKPDPLDELKKKLDAIAADNAAIKADVATTRTETVEKVGQLTGQLSMLAQAAAVPDPKNDVPAPDIVTDTQAALDHYFAKRAGPLLEQGNKQAADTQRELLAIKHKDEWNEYKDKVEALIATNRISTQILAQPGAYEQVLNLVKAKEIDEIVKKKVAAEVASFQAKAAGSAPNTAGQNSAPPGAPRESVDEPSDQEKLYMKKLGVTPERWAKARKEGVFDGIRTVGETVH